ncbi:unnamed protein product, partial [Medioppia subpectinata]
MVILAICGAIASSVVLINPDIQNKFSNKADKEKLKLDHVLQGVFNPSAYNGTWITDHELIYRDVSGDLVKLDMNSVPLKPQPLVHNQVFLFRHTYIAKHLIYNIATEETILLSPPNDKSETDLQFAGWGPRPKSSQIVFIAKNTIYYKDIANSTDTKVIVDSVGPDIYNGIPDWVYEEEVLGSSSALWWAPDGSRLCFAQFDDTKVDVMSYPWYGNGIDATNLYTKTVKIKYPKAGRPNPTFKLFVADLAKSDPS